MRRKTDLSVTHISAIENANSKFSLHTLANIASELDLSIDYLIFDSETSKGLRAKSRGFFQIALSRKRGYCSTY